MEVMVKKYMQIFEEQKLPQETLSNIENIFRDGIATGINFVVENVLLLNHVPSGYMPKPSLN